MICTVLLPFVLLFFVLPARSFPSKLDSRASAMTTTSSEPDIELLHTRRDDFLDAFNAADVDRIMSLFTPDALYSDYGAHPSPSQSYYLTHKLTSKQQSLHWIWT